MTRRQRFEIEPFRIDIPADTIDDLRRRIESARLPDQLQDDWTQGVERSALKELLDYWCGRFDWSRQQEALNRFRHFRAVADDAEIHFVHARAAGAAGLPVLLTHGWPSCFLEPLTLLPLLTHPADHGLHGPALDVVVPSYPGYAFSPPPTRVGDATPRRAAGLLRRLMGDLGYERFGAHGGDYGAGVATFLALDHPASIAGIHLSTLDEAPCTGAGSAALSSAERRFAADQERWAEEEYGYGEIQSTKPQTLGYALNDSPAGLAAWMLEKWRSWSDCRGDVWAVLDRDVFLSMLTMFWATETIVSSLRTYYDNRHATDGVVATDFVDVPTAVAIFANELVPEGKPPREWAERLYRVERFTEMPQGGHFAAMEQPRLVAQDILTFFAGCA